MRLLRRPIPEMAMWPPKTGNICISRSRSDRVEVSTANLDFRHSELEETVCERLRQRPTTGNGNVAVLGVNLAISGCPSLSQLLACTFMKLSNLSLEFRLYLSQSLRYKYFRFRRPRRYFRLSVAVAVTYRHFFELYVVTNPTCRSNFNPVRYRFRDISISGFVDILLFPVVETVMVDSSVFAV